MQQIQCPHCGAAMSLPESLAGQRVACVSCRGEFVAPGPSAAGSPAPGAVPSAPPSAPAYPPAPGGALPNSGKAIASLVLGIASIPGCILVSVPGIICGILAIVLAGSARRQIQAGTVSAGSAGMAKAGRICGWIGLILSILWFAVAFLLPVGVRTFHSQRF